MTTIKTVYKDHETIAGCPSCDNAPFLIYMGEYWCISVDGVMVVVGYCPKCSHALEATQERSGTL